MTAALGLAAVWFSTNPGRIITAPSPVIVLDDAPVFEQPLSKPPGGIAPVNGKASPAFSSLLETLPTPRPAPPVEDWESSAAKVQRENYPSGACKLQYEARVSRASAVCTGVISELSKGSRPDGPTYLLVGKLEGTPPEIGTVLEVAGGRDELVCRVKLIRCYHFDDDDSQPIEELGCATVDESTTRPCARGDVVHWDGRSEVRDGFWRAWYEDGTQAVEGRYKDGARDGDWTYFHRNGAVRARGRFKGGKPVGKWDWWYDDGGRQAHWDTSSKHRWSLWQKNGQTDAYNEPDFLDARDLFLKDYKKGNWEAALEALKALKDAIPCGDGERQDELIFRLGRVIDNWTIDNDLVQAYLEAVMDSINDSRPALPPPDFASAPLPQIDVVPPPHERDPNEP